ncbi:MAG: phosphoglycerate dehydrogenase [Clostridiales bacterium]|nr:phosphoglycerate dehydrogenase [Clostridiales bacterium]
METYKVLITPRSFGKTDSALFDLLNENGISYRCNDTGNILSEDDMTDAIADCDGVIVGVDPLTAYVMSKAPHLKAIAKYGVGTDNIDLDYCGKNGIRVSVTQGANSDAVADFAFALMLALSRKIIQIDSKCKTGDWTKIVTNDVFGRTLGLFGLGTIGKKAAERATGFAMKIIAYDPYWDEAFAEKHNITYADPDTICSESDFISLHIPLEPETKNIIDERRISLMKPDAFLINTARGGLINEDALLVALKNRRIGGAGIDVFAIEPPQNNEWFHLDNVILGSHSAASTIGAANNMGMEAVKNIMRDLNG